MLEILIGRSGSGKTARLVREAGEAIRAGEVVLYLTTRQATYQAERRLILESGLPGLLNAQVLSVDRLAQKILDETGGLCGARVTQAGFAMAVSLAARDQKDALELYGDCAMRPGFSARAARQMEQFERFGADAGALFDASYRVGEDALAKKLRDMARLFQAAE